MAAIHTPVNSSGKGPGKRNEIFYFDDSGNLNAFRHGDWKVSFAPKDSLGGLVSPSRAPFRWPSTFEVTEPMQRLKAELSIPKDVSAAGAPNLN